MIFLKENINVGPLLFIDTIKEDVKPNNQDFYDSRYKVEVKPIKEHLFKQQDTNFYIKVSRLIEMYNRNKRIICKVSLLNKEEYYVIVKESKNNVLTCLLVDNADSISFAIDQINELTIEQFN